MGNQLSFVFMLSLKEISLRKVVINLWNEREVLSSIETFFSEDQGFNYDYSEKWHQAVECNVIEKLSNLGIPKSLEKQALHIVTPIGLEIKRWKVFHEIYLRKNWGEFAKKDSVNLRIELDAPILLKLCWTTCGTVDYKKTAEELIRCEMLNILSCYELACLYCLEDSIFLLWEKLPREIKKIFYNEEGTFPWRIENVEFCWPYILKGRQSKLDCIVKQHRRDLSFNKAAFEYSARGGNKVASEYYFQKLTNEEKKTTLLTAKEIVASGIYLERYYFNTFPKAKFSDALFYLISLMNDEEQIEIFQHRTAELLFFFMDWPWHDLFPKIAVLTWTFHPARAYDSLLKKLSDQFRNQKYYFTFLNLFQELFKCSPFNFRKEFVDHECQSGEFLPRILDIQDSETIKVIFRNVDATDRARLVSCKYIFQLFWNFILTEKYDMVKLCVREATLSNEDQERLAHAFLVFRSAGRRNFDTCISTRNRFLQLMEGIYGNAQSKRNSDGDALNKAKIFRTSDKENCANELK